MPYSSVKPHRAMSATDAPPRTSRAASKDARILKASSKCQGPFLRETLPHISDPNECSRPPLQDFNEPVRARMLERLDDPEWQLAHAARCNDREAQQRAAQAEGHIPKEGRTFNPVVPIEGLPPPPAGSLGSAHLMDARSNADSPNHKVAVNFNPSNHTMIICGRPVQLLIVSHEKAGWLERDMYVPWLFRPLTGIVIDGYTA